jgi:ABC-2 type transport system ATP-binding protein
MSIIQTENLTKVNRINQKDPGLSGAIKSMVWPRHRDLVAVDQISFTVAAGEMVGYINPAEVQLTYIQFCNFHYII